MYHFYSHRSFLSCTDIAAPSSSDHVWYLCLIFMAWLQSNSPIWWIETDPRGLFPTYLSACSFVRMMEASCSSYRIAPADLEPITAPHFVSLQNMNSAPNPIYVWEEKNMQSSFLPPLRCRSISIDWLEIFSVIRLSSAASKLQASGGLDAAARSTQGLFLPRYRKHAGSGSLHGNGTFSIILQTISIYKNVHNVKHLHSFYQQISCFLSTIPV